MMRLFFADFQRVVVLNSDVLDGISMLFPALKTTIVPIRNQLTASSLNATHVINGSDGQWFSLVKLAIEFVSRANDLNQKFILQGLSGQSLIQKMNDVTLVDLNPSTIEELQTEMERVHLAFDEYLKVDEGSLLLRQAKSITDLKSFEDLFTNSPLVQLSEKVGSSGYILNAYVEEHDLNLEIKLSGSNEESAFLEKWLIQDGVEPIKLESIPDTYTFESEEQFLNWFNNFKIQFQIQLGLETLTSFFNSGSENDVKRLKQIRFDLTEILNQSEARTLLSHRKSVWNYIHNHLNEIDNPDGLVEFQEIKSIFDLEDQNFSLDFYK